MDYYIYYSKGTNHGGHDDVAVCEAQSQTEAITIFKKYYTVVTEENVQKIDINRNGFNQGIMFVSDY